MNILVIESSPHKHGSSNLLAEEFIRGAEEAGHHISVFDAGHAELHPCLGCDVCGMSDPCVQKDDMIDLRKRILAAEYGYICDTALLLRNVCPAQDGD